MSWFARIEQACAAFIERTFAKTFPSDLEPAQIARKLVATMEAKTRGGDGSLVAPGRYIVSVHPEDYNRLLPHRAYLEREWGELLVDMAQRVNIAFADGGVAVVLEELASIPLGAVEIEPAAQLQRFQLRMVRGVPSHGVYPVDGTTHVGRSEESEIFLVDPSVSRRHAVIDLQAGWPIVHDLSSTNGTFVNGERIEARRLAAGDTISFGKTELRLEVSGS
jgi:prepilin-type processing-associated H-X9-DG protein